MTTRKFLQLAQGYGPVPATITATLDGNVIYNGPVPTVDQPRPSLPDPNIDLPVAYSWEDASGLSGALPLTITVQGADIYLGTTQTQTWDVTGNAWVMTSPFIQTIDGQPIGDSFTNIKIDDIEQTPRTATPGGQWWWWVPNGSEFQATFNITACPTP